MSARGKTLLAALVTRLLLASAAFPVGAEPAGKGKIAIIIDDLGYRLNAGRAILALPHALTVSIIPHSPHALTLAREADCMADKDVLVHVPMSPDSDRRWEPGLDPRMGREEFVATASSLLASIPYAIGANNHGGSLLTRDWQHMLWLMDVLRNRSLLFVDSRTTPLTVAAEAASERHVPNLSRDIFLDNQLDDAAIGAQLAQLAQLAQTQGQAVAIGHPHPQTLRVLRQQLPELSKQGYQLVSVSGIIGRPLWQTKLPAELNTTQAIVIASHKLPTIHPKKRTDHPAQ